MIAEGLPLPPLSFRAVLACCLALLAAAPTDVQADLAAGAKAYAAGDYGAALAAWQPLADAGDANAQFNIGQLYRLGRGVAADVAQATHYYRLAAEQGHVGAQANLGTLYYFAVAGAPKIAEATRWWDAAARQGDHRSQYMLAVVYFNGKDMPRQAALAYGWMQLAAAGGVPEAVEAEKVMLRALTPAEAAAGRAFAQSVSGKEPAPVPVSAATPSTAAGGYMVQVGAFQDAAAAQSLADSLRAKHRAALDGVQAEIVAVTSNGKTLHRLRFGPYAERAAATAACRAMKQGGKPGGQPCFVTSR